MPTGPLSGHLRCAHLAHHGYSTLRRPCGLNRTVTNFADAEIFDQPVLELIEGGTAEVGGGRKLCLRQSARQAEALDFMAYLLKSLRRSA
jgi:hypothetical protein